MSNWFTFVVDNELLLFFVLIRCTNAIDAGQNEGATWNTLTLLRLSSFPCDSWALLMCDDIILVFLAHNARQNDKLKMWKDIFSLPVAHTFDVFHSKVSIIRDQTFGFALGERESHSDLWKWDESRSRSCASDFLKTRVRSLNSMNTIQNWVAIRCSFARNLLTSSTKQRKKYSLNYWIRNCMLYWRHSTRGKMSQLSR